MNDLLQMFSGKYSQKFSGQLFSRKFPEGKSSRNSFTFHTKVLEPQKPGTVGGKCGDGTMIFL